MSFHLFSPFLSCLGIRSKPRQRDDTTNSISISTYEPRYSDKDNNETDTKIATTNLIDILVNAPRSSLYNEHLHQNLNDSIKAYNWTETLARSILAKLELVLSDASKFGGAPRDVCERVAREVLEFAQDHPAYCTLIALGILVVIGMPWILEVLGFAELGPVEGKSPMLSRYSGQYLTQIPGLAYYRLVCGFVAG